MKRISLTTISIGCVAFCLIVAFGYATNSVLTPNEIREIWGGLDECQTCEPPTPWVGYPLVCNNKCKKDSDCEKTTLTRRPGYCYGNTAWYDCNPETMQPMGRYLNCVCPQDLEDSEEGTCYGPLSTGEEFHWTKSCSKIRRVESCE